MCFTHNNPTEALMFEEAEMEYLVYQEEIGDGSDAVPEGTYHFQGYCEFKTQKRLAAAKALLGGITVHIEPRRGTQEQAIAYCKKVDTRIPDTEIFEEGTPRVQGKRIDLEGFKDAVKGGAKQRDLLDDHFGILARYPRFYNTINQCFRPERSEKPEVILLIGPTGTGKTRTVMDEFGASEDFWRQPINNKTIWFDGYDGQSVVLFDDFAGKRSHIDLYTLLQMLDRYTISVPTKGGHTWWMPSKVFITTNILPKHWFGWENRAEQYVALARRFTKVVLYYVPLSILDCGHVEQHRPTWWPENAPEEAAALDYSSLSL